MNIKMIAFILSRMLSVESLLLLLPAVVALIYGEETGYWFLIVAAALFVISIIFGRKKPTHTKIYTKEGMIIVSAAWVLWSAIGALPMCLSGDIPNYIDAFFETVSGFTTTGSTILTNIESMPKCILFWRGFTHWVGGMGVLVFVLMLNTLDRNNSMHLMRAEMPGPEKDKLVPTAKQTARILYGIYLVLTLILIVLLLFGGMNLFDSIIHAFSTAGTGGYSNYNASVGYFNSAYIEWVLTIFMALFGVNFNLYFLILIREYRPIIKNEELKMYIGIILGASIMIAVNIKEIYGSVSFREAIFQVVSMITTTGFVSTDYNVWPMFSKTILLALIFTGACASSTGGGVKVSRLILMIKSIRKRIKQLIHPHSVNVIRMNGKKVSIETISMVKTYFLAYILIFLLSILVVSLDNFEFGTIFSAVLTALGNTGPIIDPIDATGSFAGFSPLSKIVLSLDMLAGRLEIFPFLMLFTLPAWHRKF
ncbi:trk system potassium uptake protein TrkH [Aequitasia blattaphilus]|uniref:TrkH family potassium uptake protein n=1 Tax=Aequitasia blattaphilus TaxID=2949332 RepID=A0ABT1E6K7_9FIRM|nr:TrkH family potassium uptake protein [Aequitasia blattaphilus]MCP1101468.1 TrkH family potassium uptake protein [Aequitasia blattaphilus]MCR8614108.1 TrkH family potassium uptake protein [Aequitasia blattaphilus]